MSPFCPATHQGLSSQGGQAGPFTLCPRWVHPDPGPQRCFSPLSFLLSGSSTTGAFSQFPQRAGGNLPALCSPSYHSFEGRLASVPGQASAAGRRTPSAVQGLALSIHSVHYSAQHRLSDLAHLLPPQLGPPSEAHIHPLPWGGGAGRGPWSPVLSSSWPP